MMLPNCPVCLTSQFLKVENIHSTSSGDSNVTYHCNQCGYKNVTLSHFELASAN